MVSVTIVQLTMFSNDLINLSEGMKTGRAGSFFVSFGFLCVKFQGAIFV